MNEINIIMYHYIRPATDNKYPGIKFLDLNSFKRQLDYLQERFVIISVDQILDSIKKKNTDLQKVTFIMVLICYNFLFTNFETYFQNSLSDISI